MAVNVYGQQKKVSNLWYDLFNVGIILRLCHDLSQAAKSQLMFSRMIILCGLPILKFKSYEVNKKIYNLLVSNICLPCR